MNNNQQAIQDAKNYWRNKKRDYYKDIKHTSRYIDSIEKNDTEYTKNFEYALFKEIKNNGYSTVIFSSPEECITSQLNYIRNLPSAIKLEDTYRQAKEDHFNYILLRSNGGDLKEQLEYTARYINGVNQNTDKDYVEAFNICISKGYEPTFESDDSYENYMSYQIDRIMNIPKDIKERDDYHRLVSELNKNNDLVVDKSLSR